jgi:hypothetical protein
LVVRRSFSEKIRVILAEFSEKTMMSMFTQHDKCDELGLTLNVTKVVSDLEDGLLRVYVPSMLYSVVKWNTKVAFTT